jgi:hypothetical protein
MTTNNWFHDLFISEAKPALGHHSGGSSGGGGGVTAWNDLTDKPFGDVTPEPLTFDGNLEGREYVYTGNNNKEEVYLVKLSDTYIAVEDMDGAIGVVHDSIYGDMEIECNVSTIASGEEAGFTNDLSWTYVIGGFPGVSVAYANETISNTDRNGVTTTYELTPGIWVACIKFADAEPHLWVSECRFPSKIKTLDETYIPDTIARTTDVDTLCERVGVLEAILAGLNVGDSNIITWDGNMDGREVVNLGVIDEFFEGVFFVHVSDRVLVKEDCIGGCATLTSSTGNNDILPIDDIASEKEGAIYFACPSDEFTPWILSTSSVIVDFLGMGEITLPSTGTYFLYSPAAIDGVPTGEVRYISKLELPIHS